MLSLIRVLRNVMQLNELGGTGQQSGSLFGGREAPNLLQDIHTILYVADQNFCLRGCLRRDLERDPVRTPNTS